MPSFYRFKLIAGITMAKITWLLSYFIQLQSYVIEGKSFGVWIYTINENSDEKDSREFYLPKWPEITALLLYNDGEDLVPESNNLSCSRAIAKFVNQAYFWNKLLINVEENYLKDRAWPIYFFAFSKVRIDNSDVDENGMRVAVSGVGDRIKILSSPSIIYINIVKPNS